jgi:hypothetical protein
MANIRPCPAEARDHLVADQERPEPVRDPAELAEIAVGRDDVAGSALDRLDQNGREVAGRFEGELLFEERDAVPAAARRVLVEGAGGARRIRR